MVQFSLDNYVLPSSVVGGDGTSLATHTSSLDRSIPDNDLDKGFSDVNADIGWNSDIKKF